jgi:hypothetical protein
MTCTQPLSRGAADLTGGVARIPRPGVRPWPLLTTCGRPGNRQRNRKLLIYLRFLESWSAGFEPEGGGSGASE